MNNHAIDPHVLDEAAAWLVQLHSGTATDADREAHRRWRALRPEHEQAWKRAQLLMGAMQDLPAGVGRATLARMPAKPGRRDALTKFAGLLLVPGAAWLAWRMLPPQEWSADYRTSTGERKSFVLPDGSELMLGTASSVDLLFDAGQRLLVLRAGEAMIATAHDPASRPFSVRTAQGHVRALGTRFTVRQFEDATHVAVLQDAVEIRPLHGTQAAVRLQAGQQARFSSTSVGAIAPDDGSAAAWTQGMLVANQMRLADLLAELARYRTGILQCDPAVADLRVSGVYPNTDTDQSLAMLASTFALHVRAHTRYWVIVGPGTR
ncbi:fec operon regulator FecR [Pigmentiphaga humi]|uniref:Fec operon regulator FecR n=1 Tax=Pigmentiphaga humi TaxID=2478468 RepID=A0A3P4AX40_9BURK|nr:FecR domain-containing protein [Pigmentiphaga humi]VCU68322.1 fec operon regulator FecR [Pigmentiphaga humi]